MRHVCRTHRVPFDWLFDRINLDPKIQITYVDTTNQLADILTKENFTRDECNHLLRLLYVQYQHLQPSQLPSNNVEKEERTGEGRINAKSRPTWNLVSATVASSPTAQSSSASNVQGILKVPRQSLSLVVCAQLKIQIKMTQRRVPKCGNQMQRRTQARRDLLLQGQTRI